MTLRNDQKRAIGQFFMAVRQLRKIGIVGSDRYLGDLGEFFAKKRYGLRLAQSKRQPGYDTEGDVGRTQIKFHNSPTRTNVNLGDPAQYDRVIVVLGPDSLLHPGGRYEGKVVFFEFDAALVRESFRNDKSFSCGKGGLGKPQKSLSINPKKTILRKRV